MKLRPAGSSLHAAIVLLTCLIASAAFADTASEPDANLGFIRYKTPPGWSVTEKAEQGARVLMSPDSTSATQAMVLLILSQPRDDLDLRSMFDASVKQITGTGKMLEAGEVAGSKSRQGFDVLSQTLLTEAPNGQHVHVHVIGAKVQNRMAELVYLSNDDTLYQKRQADVDAMLGSVSFDVAAPAAPAATARAEIAALEKQKQELLAKVADIEARQRQLAGTAAEGMGEGRSPDALAADNAARLADAKQRFAHEADARRKPHVILGDVLGLDGKPIANLASCTVRVWGTTIAAERTQYTLDVDPKGHFEQQVPDGLYWARAECIATVGGHRVPLDLLALDNRKSSVSQSSDKGIVADFRLVMEGLKPEQDEKDPRSFFGGLVNVSGPGYTPTTGNFSDRHPNAKVRLTFVPTSAAADGSKGGTFSREVPVTDLNYTAYLKCLPIAVYTVSAKVVEADGKTRPLFCARGVNAQQYTESVEIFWESAYGDQNTRGPVLLFLRE